MSSWIKRNLKDFGKSIAWYLRPETQEFSIAVLQGRSMSELKNSDGANAPVLAKEDISDIPAAFVADPFMCQFQNRWFMFFEVLNGTRWLGEIGLATSTNKVDWTYRKIVLHEPFHLSYPYVFEWEGNYYMIPETWQADEVRLYKADPFPDQWVPVHVLFRGGPFLDSSLIRHEGRWWLYSATPLRNGTMSLRLFSASNLFGKWVEHPESPLDAGDSRLARPAGRVLKYDGRLIRFSQSAIPHYGSDVWASEVLELNEYVYRERCIGTEPLLRAGPFGWNNGGMHHIDAHQIANDSWIACVDGWTSTSYRLDNLNRTFRYSRPKVGAGDFSKYDLE